MISPVELDVDEIGVLVVVDLATGSEQRIDTKVHSEWHAEAGEAPVVNYVVVDGERSGVWRARLPGAP